MKQKRRFTFGKGLGTGIVMTIIVGGLLIFALFPLVLKHRNSSPLEDRIGTNRVLAAIPGSEKDMKNPLSPSSQTIIAGRTVYLGHCSVCHGTDGTGDTPIGRNLFPPAADLTSERVTSMTDGEIAWITRNGLSFVGMPAFGTLLSDQQVWETVSYIRTLTGAAASEGSGNGAPDPTQGGAAGVSSPGQTQSPTTSELAQGKQLYEVNGCAGCHGTSAQGGVGPRLSGTRRPFSLVLARVRRGGGSMPSFSPGQISDSQVQLIYTWLESSP